MPKLDPPAGRTPSKSKSDPKPERLLRRYEAAMLLSRSERSIDAMIKEGLLRSVIWPGRKKMSGIPESDVRKLMTPEARHEAE